MQKRNGDPFGKYNLEKGDAKHWPVFATKLGVDHLQLQRHV